MANLIDLLQGQLSEGLVDHLSSQLGGADKQQTATAASGIISTMMSALAKNAATPDGASALGAALDRDHDGSILNDLMGMLAKGAEPDEVTRQHSPNLASMLNGAGILKHVLGGKQAGAIDMISKMSGLSDNKTGNLMAMLAPMVMGMLGKQKREQNLDSGGLADILSGAVKSAANDRQEMGFIEKFIDQDGDGSIMDDLAGMGMKMFGNFLKGRK